MINQRLVAAVFFFVFFIQADLLVLAQIVCENNNGNYTSDSAYSANLNATLSSLSANIGSDGFYNASTGQGTDRVDVIAICRGDVQLDTCRDCVQTGGTVLLKSCPNQMQAILWAVACTLRYLNASIYGVLSEIPTYYTRSTQNVTSPEQDCTSCLASTISQVPQCCDAKTMGKVVAPSGILLFGTYPFFNETRLRELELVHPSLPPPPHLPPQPVPGPKKKSSKKTQTIIITVAAVGVMCLIVPVSAIIFIRKSKKHKPTVINPQSK